MRKLKRILVVLLLFIVAFVGYVEIVNINSKHMTYRQKVLKAIYPVWMLWAKLTGTKANKMSNEKTTPPVPFHSLKVTLNNGEILDFASLKGKKVLLVNTASNCGYTNQYDDLQKLYEENQGKLVVVGFPANDFKEQEKGSDEEIAEFCRANFGVNFPLAKKSSVIKGPDQHAVFKWLSDASQNGWNDKQPTWNFTKFLVDEQGVLKNYFGPSLSPLSKEVVSELE